MLHLRIAAGVLIVVSVLVNCDKTECQPKQLLATLASMITSPLSEESTVRQLERRCATYERIIRTFLPDDQKATASKDDLYAHVMSQANSERSLNAKEGSVVDDIKQCIDFNFDSMKVTPPVATPASNSTSDTGIFGYQQQARAQPLKFDQKDLFILSKLNYESREEPKAERCKLFAETLRSISIRRKPELVSASAQALYQEAIKGLEGRNPPALIALRECAQDPQREQAPSSINDDNEEQRFHSKLAQLELTHEQLIEQHASNIEHVRRLGSDLARETSRALEKEREIDEFQRRVAEKAVRKALIKLRSKFESFKQDVSSLMTDYLDVSYNIANERGRIVALINKRVDEFKAVMERQLEKASDKMDALEAKQEGGSQQYVAVKEGFSKLKSGFEKFKESLAVTFSGSGQLPSFEMVRLFYQPLEQFHVILKGQLDAALNDVFAKNTEQVQGSERGELEIRQSQTQPNQLDIYSKLAQVEQAQKQLMKQRASEALRQLESTLGRETSGTSGKERKIDELEWKATGDEGRKALSELRFKFVVFKQKVSRSMTEFSNVDDWDSDMQDRPTGRGEQCNLINKQVDEFKIVMREEFGKVLSNMDTLRGKQKLEDKRYDTIKEGFTELESELEEFKKSLDEPFVHSISLSRLDLAHLTEAGLERFYEALKRQLDAASEYIGHYKR